MVKAQDIMSKNFVSIDIKETISQMLGKMKSNRVHSAIVFEKGKYKGVVTRRFLLTSRIHTEEMKISNITKKRSKSKTPFYVPTLELDTELKEICRLMAASDTHTLPVLQKDKVVGVVSSHDVISHIADAYKKIACEELASREIVTATPNEQLMKIIQKMSRNDIDHLPLVDEQGRLMGMIAMADLIDNPEFWDVRAQKISRAASHQQGKKTGYGSGEKESMLNLPARNCMSYKKMCSTAPETKIPAAINMMIENEVCNIILIRYDKPVGILTIKDLLVDYAK